MFTTDRATHGASRLVIEVVKRRNDAIALVAATPDGCPIDEAAGGREPVADTRWRRHMNATRAETRVSALVKYVRTARRIR